MIECRKPSYPAAARRAGESGVVVLALLIDTAGAVIDQRVERSSGFPRLDAAALEALGRCRFQPATLDGRREPTWARLRYVWKLED
ncbi:energy transducer TonB [Pararhodospirillum photometricum]|uniref:Periplasmic protein TonB, links inner and outer membranes n=1 Tax=Pararhodospirillum photometricum DSM 122 TaxID=1150469 RepID=H6SK68_PARPM|nr:energy transducer TonB [Pararhodospirillum photometricum]CCG08383.1 Periplasmic protein TonB, links inner and outer membranes [Pararhodospirillum photometricum DSM 122]